jgi:pimeloyl-ACP methyl ester carboxylesterase
VLGSSIGARIALELTIRGRARSVVAITPSGLGLPPERAYQGAVMSTARVLMRTIRPVIDIAARFPMGRALLLTNLRAGRSYPARPRPAHWARVSLMHPTSGSNCGGPCCPMYRSASTRSSAR